MAIRRAGSGDALASAFLTALIAAFTLMAAESVALLFLDRLV
jgi:hypothetical protein